MTLATIRTEILDIVDSPDITDTAVDSLINKALLYISARVPLPALEMYDEIDITGITFPVNRVSLPDDYQRGLFYCNDGNDITILSSAARLQREGAFFSGDSWRVCAVSQSEILFSDTVEIDTLITIGYLRNPETDEVDIFPPGHEEDPIVNYCCWKLFNKIEDGDDGRTPNTTKYQGYLRKDIKELRTLLQESQPQRRPTSATKQWI